jgi:predicted esterase
MKEFEVSFNFKARYYTLGEITPATQKVWFVFHGYGQLAQFFLRKFSPLENGETCIIAPEGLSHFYLEDVASRSQTGNNKVGATWMTRENRLADIENYITYLNYVFEKVIPRTFKGQITLCGFSQGAATVSRWALYGNAPFHRLILWAGIFPPDMDFKRGTEILSDKDVIEVFGNKDPFLTDERLKEMTQLNNQLGINPRLVSFDGGHEVNSEILLQFQ